MKKLFNGPVFIQIYLKLKKKLANQQVVFKQNKKVVKNMNCLFRSNFLSNMTKLCSGPALPVHIFNVWTIITQKEWNLFEL